MDALIDELVGSMHSEVQDKNSFGKKLRASSFATSSFGQAMGKTADDAADRAQKDADDDTGGEPAEQIEELIRWASNRAAVAAHMAKHNLAGQLGRRPKAGSAQAGPLVRIEGLLPEAVATGAHAAISTLPAAAWELQVSHRLCFCVSTAFVAKTPPFLPVLQAAQTDVGLAEYGAGTTDHSYAATAGESAETDGAAANGRGRGGSSRAELGVRLLREAIGQLLPGRVRRLQLGRYTAGDFIEPHDDAAYVEVDGGQWSRDVVRSPAPGSLCVCVSLCLCVFVSLCLCV